jgi:O-antigen ligase
MKKRYPDTRQEHDYGVGFPLGVIAFLMVAISAYLIVMNAQIDPPHTAVFVSQSQ